MDFEQQVVCVVVEWVMWCVGWMYEVVVFLICCVIFVCCDVDQVLVVVDQVYFFVVVVQEWYVCVCVGIELYDLGLDVVFCVFVQCIDEYDLVDVVVECCWVFLFECCEIDDVF